MNSHQHHRPRLQVVHRRQPGQHASSPEINLQDHPHRHQLPHEMLPQHIYSEHQLPVSARPETPPIHHPRPMHRSPLAALQQESYQNNITGGIQSYSPSLSTEADSRQQRTHMQPYSPYSSAVHTFTLALEHSACAAWPTIASDSPPLKRRRYETPHPRKNPHQPTQNMCNFHCALSIFCSICK